MKWLKRLFQVTDAIRESTDLTCEHGAATEDGFGNVAVEYAFIDEKTTGYALGAAEYMTKPVDRDHLVEVLKKFRNNASTRPVLVVEDGPSVREIVRRALSQEGLKVLGIEALARLAESSPSLILLDLMMPELDGFGFLEELRRRDEWNKIPVVVLTAKDISSDDRVRLEGFTSAVLVKKGQSPDALIREMRDLIREATGSGVSA